MKEIIKKDIVIISSIVFMIVALMATIFLIASDFAVVTGMDLRSQDTSLEMSKALEHYINNQNKLGIERVFFNREHASAFRDIFFGKEVKVTIGFSDKENIISKNQLSKRDLPSIRKGYMKDLTETAGLTYLIIKEIRDDSNNMITAPAVIIQKGKEGWVITEIYDLMYTNSTFVEIQDFRINYLESDFYISLTARYDDKFRESTLLYNFAQLVTNITVSHRGEILCTMDRSHITAEGDGFTSKIRDDRLYNPKQIVIESECDPGSIASIERNKKYTINIDINSQKDSTNIIYYGNMII